MCRQLLLIGILLVAGCTQTPLYERAEFVQGRADASFAMAQADTSNPSAPDTDDDFVVGEECPSCEGTGRSGDGLGKCGDCGGDGRIDEADITTPVVNNGNLPKAPSLENSKVWYATLAEAEEVAAQQDKPIFVYFTAPFCTVCVPFQEKCLDHPDILEKLAGFVCVKMMYTADRNFTADEADIFLKTQTGERRKPGWPYCAVVQGDDVYRFTPKVMIDRATAHPQMRGLFVEHLEQGLILTRKVEYNGNTF